MYGRENYLKAKETVSQRRADAIALSEARSEKVRLISKKIAELDDELSATGILIFKTALAGGDIDKIKKRNRALIKEREDELVRLGFDKEYTDVKFYCEECSDTGFIDTRMCTCMREIIIRENINSSGMGGLMDSQSFDNFDLQVYKSDSKSYERMKQNLEAARDFAENFKIPSNKSLLLMGCTGLGKTHISTSIARVVIGKGYEVLYETSQNIFDSFENDKFRRGYSQTEPQSQKYLECDLLIVDDLGTEFNTQFTVSCLYNIINTRMNKGLPTILSTNLSSKDFNARYEDRIYSRMVGGSFRVLQFVGEDYRIFKK